MIILSKHLISKSFCKHGTMGQYETFSKSQGMRYLWVKTWASKMGCKWSMPTNHKAIYNLLAREGFLASWAQIDNRVECIMGSISSANPWQPNNIEKSHQMLSRRFFSLKWGIFSIYQGKKTILLPPQGFSQIWMWIVLETTTNTTTTQYHCYILHLEL